MNTYISQNFTTQEEKRDKKYSNKTFDWFYNKIRTKAEFATVMDIDLVVFNSFKHKVTKFMYLELKTYMAEPTTQQKIWINFMNETYMHNKKYYGYHLLQFEKETPNEGDVVLNGNLITEKELITFLHLEFMGKQRQKYLDSTIQYKL